jgi:hypothetical protein
VKLAAVALTAVGVIGWVAHWWGVAGRRRAAAYALALLAGYAGAQAISATRASARAREAALARFGPDATWAALTVPGRPFDWELMYAGADTVAGPNWAQPRRLNDARVRYAVGRTREGRAMAQFARFLVAEVDSGSSGVRVVLRDARYAQAGDSGWGVVAVSLPSDPAR